MTQCRVVRETELRDEVNKMMRSGERAWAANRLMEWFRRQPEVQDDDEGDEGRGIPPLVGSTAAAAILGIPAPHVARLRRQGRMPEPVHVEGGHDVYVRSEVEALAAVLRSERGPKQGG